MLLVVAQRGVGARDGKAAIEQRVAVGGGAAQRGEDVLVRGVGRGCNGKLRELKVPAVYQRPLPAALKTT